VVHVTVGFPSTRAISTKKRRIGECWLPSAAADGAPHIFISPILGDEGEVAATLVHELVHAALPEGTGHTKPFAQLAKRTGLAGKPTATVAGEELKSELSALLKELGPYPHSALRADGRPTKKQTTRLLKAVCEKCGYTVRVTGKWLEVGPPICPTDNIPLTPEGEAEAEDEEDSENEGE
jgi:hypothetical protein